MEVTSKKTSELQKLKGSKFFSKVDLKYTYGQIPLHKETQKHCNFSILGVNATGKYRFMNGFYGLTDMPATIQKAMDFTLNNIISLMNS